MANVEITRISEIVVDTVSKNTYGDLVFTDKGGVQYKVGAKRVSYFENIIQSGAAVQLNYAMSGFGKEYIYNATQIKDHIPPAQEPKPMPTEQIPKKDLPQKVIEKVIAPQETGMWWKELGEALRSGEIDKTTPQGKLLRQAYYAEMFRVLNLKFEKKGE